MSKLVEKKRKLEYYRGKLRSVQVKGLKKATIEALRWNVSYRNQM